MLKQTDRPSLPHDQRLAARIGALRAVFDRAGFARADVPFLQPADIFVELSGEDIRRRLLLTTDADGNELCLRPEFTIPAARAYLAEGLNGDRRDLAFLGPVFRQRSRESGEFWQASIESIGRDDREAADAELVATTLEAVAVLGAETPAVTMSDLDVVAAFLDNMKLGEALRRRLRAAYAAGDFRRLTTKSHETEVQTGLSRYPGVVSALKGADLGEARAFVTDLLALAGLAHVGGRSPEEIADRFLRQAEVAGDILSEEQRGLIEAFLSIEGDPDEAALALRRLSAEAGFYLEGPLDRFEARLGFMAARGVELSEIKASMRFARSLDYYTGMVFEVREHPASDLPVAGGGRYDTLLARLGSTRSIPAVGAAIWIERLGERRGGET